MDDGERTKEARTTIDRQTDRQLAFFVPVALIRDCMPYASGWGTRSSSSPFLMFFLFFFFSPVYPPGTLPPPDCFTSPCLLAPRCSHRSTDRLDGLALFFFSSERYLVARFNFILLLLLSSSLQLSTCIFFVLTLAHPWCSSCWCCDNLPLCSWSRISAELITHTFAWIPTTLLIPGSISM